MKNEIDHCILLFPSLFYAELGIYPRLLYMQNSLTINIIIITIMHLSSESDILGSLLPFPHQESFH